MSSWWVPVALGIFLIGVTKSGFGSYFFFLNTARILSYWLAGQFTNVSPMLAVEFLPFVFLGAIFGVWLNRRISEKLFSTVVYVVTFGLGVYILVEGVHTLVHG